MSFYAVANGRQNGIFSTWKECSDSIKGYSNAKYKKFFSKKDAEDFINSNKEIIEIMKTNKVMGENMTNPDYYVYTDGACSNNGKKDASAGIGIYFGENDPRNISEKIDGKQTNNTAELTALIRVYTLLEKDILLGKKIVVVSDSEYAIRCVTSYGKKCEESGWKKEIPNKELVKQAYELYKECTQVEFKHIMAHTQKTDIHSLGNEKADELANQAIGLSACPYQK
jgi:ribonuclease HI